MSRTPGTHLAVLPSLAGRTSTPSLRRLAIHPTESLAALAIPRGPRKSMHAPRARAPPDARPAVTTGEARLPDHLPRLPRTAAPVADRPGRGQGADRAARP